MFTNSINWEHHAATYWQRFFHAGDPVFHAAIASKCVSVAFQSLDGSDAENIGYLISTPIIHHF